jgi:hypothetical protein
MIMPAKLDLLMPHAPVWQHDASPSPAGLALETGRVLRCAPVGFVVDIAGAEHAAVAAASCLLVPGPGDLVMAADVNGKVYILAVLERPGAAEAVLSAGVPSGTLRIEAAHLALRAGEDMTITAPRATIAAGILTVTADALTQAARLLTQAVTRWTLSSRTVEIVADDISTSAARRVSVVSETDLLKAGALVQTLDTAVTSAESAVFAARQDLRLDGERVTVG